MKILLSISLFIFFTNSLFGQVTLGMASKGIDMNMQPGGTITQIPLLEKELIGSVYLDDSWSLGQILFINQQVLNGYLLRYDLKHNIIEIKVDKEIKGLTGNAVQSFKLEKNGIYEEFLNAKTTLGEGSGYTGFLEKIDSGAKWILYKNVYIKIIEGAYVAALDMGDNSTQIVKRETFLFVNGTKIIEVESSKNKFVSNFGIQADGVLKFIKTNKLVLKNESHLKSILFYLNEN